MVRTEGQRLVRKYLDERGLTQRALAQQIGCSDAQVSLWLSGTNLPDVVSAARLEEVTGIAPRTWSEKPNGKRKH